MKKLNLILIPIWILISCTQKKTEENDWTKMGLKGRVKILKINKGTAKFKFGFLVDESQPKMYPEVPDEYYVFNNRGRIIEEFKQDSYFNETRVAKEYDENNNLIKENKLEYYTKEDEFNDKKKYRIEQYYYKYKNIYDSRKNLIFSSKYQTLSSGDILMRVTKFTYNNSGNIIFLQEYNGDGSELYKVEYEYNIFGQLKEKPKYGGISVDSNIKYRDDPKYEYDGYHNVINESSKKSKEYFHYQYQYDNYKNVTKFYSFSGKKGLYPKRVETREIEYFKDNEKTTDQNVMQEYNRDRMILYPKSWQIVEFANIGSIAIPPDMEIRDDSAQISKILAIFKVGFESKMQTEIVKPHLIIQTKGINENALDANKNYARIIINVEKGRNGDFPKADYPLTYKELSELNSNRKKQTQYFVKNLGMEIVQWQSPRNIKINDINIIELNYIRAIVSTYKSLVPDFLNLPDRYRYYESGVKVADYTVYDDNIMINITVSYRLDFIYNDLSFDKTEQGIDLDFLIYTLDIKK